ncbi:MAG: hypothetical protein KDK24_17280 [Pseudooceanicola sp.]|nr:hypothetical protein [Pseudooceanicola sp.]
MRAILSVLLLAALPAHADDCRDRIAGMFFGGALDPTLRPPYHLTVNTLKADGSYVHSYDVTWLAVDQAMTASNGMYSLMRGEKAWLANSPDGPWTFSPPAEPFDSVNRDIAQRRQMVANLSDTSCDGMYTLDGKTVERFVYRTMTRDDSNGTYFGALNTIYVDPETNLLVRLDDAEFVAHYAPQPSPDRNIMQYTYDPALTLPQPQ